MLKVSVVLTSYNHENYIREAIDSVLAQTFSEFELIILDDASADNSWNIIESYTDSRIKKFRNHANTRGLINKAISDFVTGEYVAVQHSDDVWEPDKLEKQVAFLDSCSEYGAVFTLAQIIDEHGNYVDNDWFIQDNRTRWQWLNQLFNEQCHLNHPSVLIRVSCIRDVGVYKNYLMQTPDAEMWSRVLLRYPIFVIQERLTKHRLFTNLSNTSSDRVDVAIRTANEWRVTRRNFLQVQSFDDFVEIFPSVGRFHRANGFDIQFLLAMACMSECKSSGAWGFGLELLYEIFDDPDWSSKIFEIYGFSANDFMALTSRFDVYQIGMSRANDALYQNKEWLAAQCLASQGALSACQGALSACQGDLSACQGELSRLGRQFDRLKSQRIISLLYKIGLLHDY